MIALAFDRARYRLMRAGTGAMVSGTVSTALDEACLEQHLDRVRLRPAAPLGAPDDA
jgi:hypothetical protein